MNSEQQDQQQTFRYLFIITPLEIKSNSKLKTTPNKSILIKLGNKTAKCTALNTPIELDIDALYSKTLQKYCPIKGIIKIYDVGEDGTEIISCVGGFQTDELLNEGKMRVVLEKEIGTSKLKMEINIINKTDNKEGNSEKEQPRPTLSMSREKYMTKKNTNQKMSTPPISIASSRVGAAGTPVGSSAVDARKINGIMGGRESSAAKNLQIPYKNTSSNINKSLQKINQALSFKKFQDSAISTKANEVLAKAELQTTKQQLSEERRKIGQLDQKYNKIVQKLTAVRSSGLAHQSQTKETVELFKKLMECLQLAPNNQFITQINEANNTLTVKYSNKLLEKALKDLIEYGQKLTATILPSIDLDCDTSQKDRSWHQLQQTKKQITILKKLTMEKDKKIYSLQKQMEGVEATIHNLKETNRHLSQQNQYLREKNDQVELSIYHKQNALDSLRKQVQKYEYQLQQFQSKLYNSQLQIEELKEEVSNCNETIQKYRQKYGDMKGVKNRAIQMEIKECLRWIDLQNRELQMSEMEETMQTDHKDQRDDSLSSVIRNIEIEKVPVQEMSIIRNQLMRILDKVNNLMNK